MGKLQIVIIAILVFGLLAFKINQPFWGHHEFNGVFYGMIAKNYIRYGLLKTRGAQVTNLYSASPDEWSYHTHHPATYPLLLSFFFRLFGAEEAVTRIISIAASILGMVILGKLLTEMYEFKYAWLGVIPLFFTPLFRYYGSLPVFEPILFPLIMWGFYEYWKSRNTGRVNKVIFISVIAMLVDWPGFWLPLWLVVLELLSRKRQKLILRLVLSIFISLLLIVVLQIIATENINDLLKVGRYRFQAAPYTPYEWLRLLIARMRAFFSDAVLLSAFLGLLYLLRNKQLTSQKLLLFSSLGVGLTHILVFRNITWYHDYMFYHTLPFFGLSLGGFLFAINKRLKSSRVILGIVILISLFTFFQSKRFFADLVKMQGHRDCVEMGQQVRSSNIKLSFELSSEKAKECPPFIGFYGEKPFTVEVKKD